MIKEIFIKPTRRKCSISDYKCIDVYDRAGNKIIGPDCDVIELEVNDRYVFSIDVVDGKIRVFTRCKAELEPLICTFIMKAKVK